jgi:hypothetical protein
MQKYTIVNLESILKDFVSWSLEQSYLNQQHEDNLKILNCASNAQKLIWKLRNFSTA